MIKTENDKKEKYQSWTAKIERDGSDAMGHHTTYFAGYGASEYEAKANVIQQVSNLIKSLKRVGDEI